MVAKISVIQELAATTDGNEHMCHMLIISPVPFLLQLTLLLIVYFAYQYYVIKKYNEKIRGAMRIYMCVMLGLQVASLLNAYMMIIVPGALDYQ